jgi:hypothetical protein
MFSNLTDFAFQRTAKQAFGFYIAYIVAILIIMFLVGLCYAAIMSVGAGYEFSTDVQGKKLIRLTEIISCLGFTALVALNKTISGITIFIYIGVACILTIFLSVFAGLLPVTYLTTKL